MTENDSAWEKTSWKDHRLAQHRAFHALSFEDKLKAVEEMADFAREMCGSDTPQKRHSIGSERRTDNPHAPESKVGETKRTTAAVKKDEQSDDFWHGIQVECDFRALRKEIPKLKRYVQPAESLLACEDPPMRRQSKL